MSCTGSFPTRRSSPRIARISRPLRGSRRRDASGSRWRPSSPSPDDGPDPLATLRRRTRRTRRRASADAARRAAGGGNGRLACTPASRVLARSWSRRRFARSKRHARSSSLHRASTQIGHRGFVPRCFSTRPAGRMRPNRARRRPSADARPCRVPPSRAGGVGPGAGRGACGGSRMNPRPAVRCERRSPKFNLGPASI